MNHKTKKKVKLDQKLKKIFLFKSIVKKIKRQTTGWKNMAKIFQVRDLDIE